jgi:hypothetical protein
MKYRNYLGQKNQIPPTQLCVTLSSLGKLKHSNKNLYEFSFHQKRYKRQKLPNVCSN